MHSMLLLRFQHPCDVHYSLPVSSMHTKSQSLQSSSFFNAYQITIFTVFQFLQCIPNHNHYSLPVSSMHTKSQSLQSSSFFNAYQITIHLLNNASFIRCLLTIFNVARYVPELAGQLMALKNIKMF